MQYQVEVFDSATQHATRITIEAKNELMIWPQVVRIARRLKDCTNTRIRVRDASGQVVVLTSAAAALAVSMEYDRSAA
jgi:hypothetical protein